MKSELAARLTPPETKNHSSVARIADDWYIVCESKKLRRKPMQVTLLGAPIVLFRNKNGAVGALLDRCPHRNVPLSAGKVKNENLECAYHGWQFNTGGVCKLVPGLNAEHEKKGRNAASYAVKEQDGFVWLYATPGVKPERDPYHFSLINHGDYTTVTQELSIEGSVHAVAENALDVPHTAYLHGGLFRSENTEKNELDVVVRRWHDRVEAEFIGEPRPEGLAGKVLAPKGGTVTHFDRFYLPSILQVEYKLGESSHLNLAAALTPVTDFETRLFAVVTFRLPFPGWLIKTLVKPVVLFIFGQDARMLKKQTETIERFGGEQYVSTEIDVLGPHILRLLRQAERGERTSVEEPTVKRLKMLT